MKYLELCSILADVVRNWPQQTGSDIYTMRPNTFATITTADQVLEPFLGRDSRYANVPWFFSRSWDHAMGAPSAQRVFDYPAVLCYEIPGGGIREDGGCLASELNLVLSVMDLARKTAENDSEEYVNPLLRTPEEVSVWLLELLLGLVSRLNSYVELPEEVTNNGDVIPPGWYQRDHLQAMFGDIEKEGPFSPVTNFVSLVPGSMTFVDLANKDGACARMIQLRLLHRSSRVNDQMYNVYPNERLGDLLPQ